jgi:hypothetical protein
MGKKVWHSEIANVQFWPRLEFVRFFVFCKLRPILNVGQFRLEMAANGSELPSELGPNRRGSETELMRKGCQGAGMAVARPSAVQRHRRSPCRFLPGLNNRLEHSIIVVNISQEQIARCG